MLTRQSLIPTLAVLDLPTIDDCELAEHPGAVRDGAALLAGIVHCGRCGGRHMTVRYTTSAHGYARSRASSA